MTPTKTHATPKSNMSVNGFMAMFNALKKMHWFLASH